MQGCQLPRIAWREEPKYEQKIVIFWYFAVVFALHLRPSNCVSVLRISNKQKKKKGYVFLDGWDFTCLAGCFAFMREILHAWRESVRISVQVLNAWELTVLLYMWSFMKGIPVKVNIIQWRLIWQSVLTLSFQANFKSSFVWKPMIIKIIYTLRANYVNYVHAVANLNSGYSTQYTRKLRIIMIIFVK